MILLILSKHNWFELISQQGFVCAIVVFILNYLLHKIFSLLYNRKKSNTGIEYFWSQNGYNDPDCKRLHACKEEDYNVIML